MEKQVTSIDNNDYILDNHIISTLYLILDEILKARYWISTYYNIVEKDDDYIFIEWPKHDIFCCIFSKGVEIDKTCIDKNGIIRHKTVGLYHKDIKSRFLIELKKIILL